MGTAYQLTNKHIAVNIDRQGRLVDYSYPDKGDSNLLLRETCGELIYLNNEHVEPNWQLGYSIDQEKLFPRLSAEIQGNWGKLSCVLDISINNVSLTKTYEFNNYGDHELIIDVFNYNNFDFGSNRGRDTAVYYPPLQAIVHYERDVYVAVGSNLVPTQFAVQGQADFNGSGALPDRNLKLTGNPVTTGIASTCLHYRIKCAPGQAQRLAIHYIPGTGYSDISAKWKQGKATETLAARSDYLPGSVPLDPAVSELAQQLGLDTEEKSKLALLAKVSKQIVVGSFSGHNGTFAGLDSSIFKAGGVDDYSYFWPRDGALTVLSYLRAFPANIDHSLMWDFFNFAAKCFGDNPYLMHRYRLDPQASLASSWYPWLDPNGNASLPLQLDQTALISLVYAKYLNNFSKIAEPVAALDQRLPEIARFLIAAGKGESLHTPCYDLWENDWGIYFATGVAICASYKALANLFNQQGREVELTTELSSAERDLSAKLQNFLVQEDLNTHQRFQRGQLLEFSVTGSPITIADSSFHWAWQLGVFPLGNQELTNTLAHARKKLALDNGGFARYEQDQYLRKPATATGNPWYISTLWFCQYFLKTGDLEAARTALRYVLTHMDDTGLLPEMADPESGFAMSIKPLVWSHAEVLNLLHWNKI